jgi:hypothetical protein
MCESSHEKGAPSIYPGAVAPTRVAGRSDTYIVRMCAATLF